MDEETEHWPVPPRFRDELDSIKFEYRAMPLPVYLHDRFVEPAFVNDTVRGALVEIHFEFRHFAILKKVQDSFNASIEQIIVIRPGESRPATGYKRKNVRDGPIRMNPNIPLHKVVLTTKVKEDDKENNAGSMSEKRRGKQKAKDSEDEVEDDVKKDSAWYVCRFLAETALHFATQMTSCTRSIRISLFRCRRFSYYVRGSNERKTV